MSDFQQTLTSLSLLHTSLYRMQLFQNSHAVKNVKTDVISIISRLEAAERERDELRAEQAEHDEQIARMESKFSLAKRALDSKTARCDKAEAELRRRDAAAGEPAVLPELEQDVKNIIGLLSGNEWAEHCTKSALGRKLENEITELHNTYSRAHAVLPPDITFESKGFLSLTSEDFAYNRALEDVRKLGAQPQKVVELKADWVVRKGKEPCAQAFCNGYALRAYEDKAALDAAGVKWEVKK